MAAELFQTSRIEAGFDDNGNIAQSALAAVKRYGCYTTRFEFIGKVWDAHEKLTGSTLPTAADELLGGIMTPNLRTMSIQFEFSLSLSGFEFKYLEDDAEVEEAEHTLYWRALMNETWQALSTNLTAKELIVREFLPKWTSAFRTNAFRQFLSRIKSAKLWIFIDEGDSWNSNHNEGYCEFVADLDNCLFRHMSNLKHLELYAGDPLGHSGYAHISLPLKPHDMPLLESLKLTNSFICPELVSFIRGHSKLLTWLDITRCVSASEVDREVEDALSWAEFFDSICQIHSISFKLIIRTEKVPLNSNESCMGRYGDEDVEDIDNYYEEDAPSELQNARRMLDEDKRLRLFEYAYVHDKYGTLDSDWKKNLAQFQLGDDQKAYDRLLSLLDKNRADEQDRYRRKGE